MWIPHSPETRRSDELSNYMSDANYPSLQVAKIKTQDQTKRDPIIPKFQVNIINTQKPNHKKANNSYSQTEKLIEWRILSYCSKQTLIKKQKQQNLQAELEKTHQNSMKIRYSPEDALKQTQKLYTPKFNLTMNKSQTLQSLSKTLDSASMGHLVHHSNQDHWDTTTKFRNYSPHLKVQNHKR